MTAAYSARSHVGKIRKQNEDNLYVDGVYLNDQIRSYPFAIDGCTAIPVVFAICDGMGGEENGEVASMLAVSNLEKISEQIKTCPQNNMYEFVQNYVNTVNTEIHSAFFNTDKRVGTTLALAVIDNSGMQCFNIGDTKIFAFGKKKLMQVSNDHTLINDKLRRGLITEEAAQTDKDRHKLTRCIGIGRSCAVDSYPVIDLKKRLLICSDGLTDMVSKDNIEMILRKYRRTSDAADALLNAALENGGKDNVTLIIADIYKDRKFLHKISNILRWKFV